MTPRGINLIYFIKPTKKTEFACFSKRLKTPGHISMNKVGRSLKRRSLQRNKRKETRRRVMKLSLEVSYWKFRMTNRDKKKKIVKSGGDKNTELLAK